MTLKLSNGKLHLPGGIVAEFAEAEISTISYSVSRVKPVPKKITKTSETKKDLQRLIPSRKKGKAAKRAGGEGRRSAADDEAHVMNYITKHGQAEVNDLFEHMVKKNGYKFAKPVLSNRLWVMTNKKLLKNIGRGTYAFRRDSGNSVKASERRRGISAGRDATKKGLGAEPVRQRIDTKDMVTSMEREDGVEYVNPKDMGY